MAIILAPGPTMTPDWLWDAMRKETIHHRTSAYRSLVQEVHEHMRILFGAPEAEILFYSAAGTDMMEKVLANFLRPPMFGLVVDTGFFGRRWFDMALCHTSRVGCVRSRSGETCPMKTFDEALKCMRPDIVLMQAADTSTGIRNVIKKFWAGLRAYAPHALLAVDAILEAGTSRLNMATDGIDILIGASQKAFMLPPGLGFILLGPRAVERLGSVHAEMVTMNLWNELNNARQYQYTYTTPTMHLVGLRTVLRYILAREGDWYHAHATRKWVMDMALGEIGFTRYPHGLESNATSVVRVPKGMRATQIADQLEHRGYVVATGIGTLRDKVLRIAHFAGVSQEDRAAFLHVLNEIL